MSLHLRLRISPFRIPVVGRKRLMFYFNGRNMRLTDVAGELIPQIVA